MNLHYSQTEDIEDSWTDEFDYHMNLHYSQTRDNTGKANHVFDYHMNLHYSQTMPQHLTTLYLV